MCAYPFIKLMEAAEPIRDFEITLSAIGKNLESLRIMFANDHKSIHLSYFGFHSKYIFIDEEYRIKMKKNFVSN